MKEIERKFLVRNHQFKQEAHHFYEIKQAYLQKDPAKSVRIRISGNRAWLTIKGISDKQGLVRNEWEYSIPIKDAEDLISLCEKAIKKTRYEVKYKKLLFEVDVFHAQNDDLVVAEVELQDELAKVEKPNWLGQEITGETRYYNLALLDFPYQEW